MQDKEEIMDGNIVNLGTSETVKATVVTKREEGMNDEMRRRIRNANRVDRIMTGILYGVGGFFLILLILLAGYIIIKGILDFQPEFFRFRERASGISFLIPYISYFCLCS